MSINISNNWNNVINDTIANNKVNQQLRKDLNNVEDKELMEACRSFESYFVEILFKEMRSSVGESTLLPKSQGTKIFEDMLYQEYSKEAVKGNGIGIAQMLYKQMAKKTIE